MLVWGYVVLNRCRYSINMCVCICKVDCLLNVYFSKFTRDSNMLLYRFCYGCDIHTNNDVGVFGCVFSN